MGRIYEIAYAFDRAMKVSPQGKKTVTTADFVHELAKVNWDWTRRQANEWIEMSVSTFKDISTGDGDNRTFMVYNPNGGR
ncbi:hypothetical protein [Siccibacter colletis]|uniref:hypothetical protein n=1 Tax=Siccibacter colletis TaxID=1505757 RepID=UPI00221EDF27|nr:hypothetical protein [Siccibacter colletis]